MADSKPVKQEVNGTVILPPLEFPGMFHGVKSIELSLCYRKKRQIEITLSLTCKRTVYFGISKEV
jgi:hypothetical protein